MNSLIIFAVFVMAAYIFQMFLGWQQLKDFNKTYTMLRKLGRVAIGRKSGRIKSGTIVMFAVDENGRVLKASKMQGVTILARFQNMDDYVGEDIHYFDKYNPLVRKENKLMQSAIEEKSIFGMRQVLRKRQVHLILFWDSAFMRITYNYLLNSYLKKIRKGVPYESHYKFCREFYETLPIRWRNLY